jgi:hypothetical protein
VTGPVRSEVAELVKLGPFSVGARSDGRDVALREGLARRLDGPTTEEEARSLIVLFGEDSLDGG